MLQRTRRTRWRVALGFVAASVVASACASHANDTTSDDALGGAPHASASTPATNDLAVLTNESPSGGADFTFCAKPPAGQPLQLTNAAWLAMVSANEYAYLGYFAPQLLDFGFGSAADTLWGQCGLDFSRVKKFEAAHAAELGAARERGADALVQTIRHETKDSPESFGACARDFLDKSYTGMDEDGATQMPSDALKDYLVRRSHDTNWIQFFSAKPFTFLERQLGRGSTQALVTRHGKKPVIVIAFRGTEPPTAEGDQYRQYADLLKDADFFKTDLSKFGFSNGWGSAHRGFVNGLAALDDPEHQTVLLDKLQALTKDNPDIGIWITGHSLGAALATLMAARVLDRIEQGAHFNLKGLYTFGSPMVGNDTFKQKLEDTAKKHGVTIARFRNDQDVITAFPGVLSVLNYKHVGPIAFLQQSGLTLPSSDPGYGQKTIDDHSISGIVGPPDERARKSGYYARIVAQLKNAPSAALTACGE